MSVITLMQRALVVVAVAMVFMAGLSALTDIVNR